MAIPDPALALEGEPLAWSGSLSSNTDLLDFFPFHRKSFFGQARQRNLPLTSLTHPSRSKGSGLPGLLIRVASILCDRPRHRISGLSAWLEVHFGPLGANLVETRGRLPKISANAGLANGRSFLVLCILRIGSSCLFSRTHKKANPCCMEVC